MSTRGFQAEVQALRALAVVLVVIFHLWPDRLTGGFVGVDVFFVISGYLITAHLMRELETTGHIKLSSFYARRIRRLLPAAFLVLVVTGAGVLLVVDRAAWPSMFRDIWSSAVYAVNWVQAATSVDYFAAESAASPVQHYWSLAVEEQFYIVWPLLLLIAWKLRRHRGIVVALILVFVASLIYSMIGAQSFQQFAYFATPSHAWEFAAGAGLALATPYMRVRDGWWLTVAVWAGWFAILASAILLNGSSPFPGWIAILPVAGTLIVIMCGMPRGAWSPSDLVGWRPVQFIGDISYSLYLWHWPLIVLMPYALSQAIGRDYLLGWEKVLIFAVCVLLAWATKALVEDPARVSSWIREPRRTYIVAGVATALIVGLAVTPASLVAIERNDRATQLDAAAEGLLDNSAGLCIGALAAESPDDCTDSHRIGDPESIEFLADDDEFSWVARHAESESFFDAHCATADSGNEMCRYGDEDSDQASIAIVGDSHAGHLLPAVLTAAHANGWAVDVWRIAECTPAVSTFKTDEPDSRPQCQSWREGIFDDLAASDADVVVTTSFSARYSRWMERRGVSMEPLEDGFIEGWQTWVEADKSVLAVADVPMWSKNIPNCVRASDVIDDPCREQAKFAIFTDPIMNAVERADDSRIVGLDNTDVFCEEKVCHSVVGGLVVARDTTHLTAAFSATLGSRFESEIQQLLDR